MQQLITCVMGDNCSNFLDMCFSSVLNSEKIVFCWGEEDNKTMEKYKEWKLKYPNKFELISLKYNKEDKRQNGITRNFYLNYLKTNYPNDWVLCLDADEVVEDYDKLRNFVNNAPEGVYSVSMRHFIGDLGHEDATNKEHYVLNRLFKISEADKYPEVEHPVLIPKDLNKQYQTKATTIWHLSYIPNLFEFKKKYENHLAKSNMHTPAYLMNWYYSHLFGTYPKSQVNPIDIPETILNHFGVDKDLFYFQNRQLEIKHFIMSRQWLNGFYEYVECPRDYKPRVLDLGCGFGVYGFPIKDEVNYKGIELSKYACQTNPYQMNIQQGNILDHEANGEDIILMIDVLEHLTEQELDKVLINFKNPNTYYIVSIPFEGDENLYKDKTHKIFKNKEWWLKKLGEIMEIKQTPNWLFSNQIIVGVGK
jgi:hypothetical protein